jgi:uncharacterized protein GlcG (DUF336 family)
MNITLKQAQYVIDTAIKKPKELGKKMIIAVIDSGINLTTFILEDDAWFGYIDVAIKKA